MSIRTIHTGTQKQMSRFPPIIATVDFELTTNATSYVLPIGTKREKQNKYSSNEAISCRSTRAKQLFYDHDSNTVPLKIDKAKSHFMYRMFPNSGHIKPESFLKPKKICGIILRKKVLIQRRSYVFRAVKKNLIVLGPRKSSYTRLWYLSWILLSHSRPWSKKVIYELYIFLYNYTYLCTTYIIIRIWHIQLYMLCIIIMH